MPSPDRLSFSLAPDALVRFVDSQVQKAPGTAQALAILTALECFIGNFIDPVARAKPAYQDVRQHLSVSMQELRQQLLLEHTAGLRSAMQDQDVAALAQLHAHLSRGAFHEAAAGVLDAVAPAEYRAIRAWVTQWCTAVQQRMEAGGGCPGAVRLELVGLSAGEYWAMQDLRSVVSG